jgi:hypothetical protein
VSLYDAGVLVRTEKDRNGDGKPDVIASYRDGQIDEQEEDSDFDGRMDRKSAAGQGGTRVQEADSNGDGKIDTWITTDAAGAVLRKEEDRSGDGKPDLTAWFESGKLVRLEQDTKGRGCVDLQQWFDAGEKVRAEYRDTNDDCRIDVWSFFENDRIVLQGLDSKGKGQPDVLNHLDADGKIRVQEVASGENGANPDKKLFLATDGSVEAQCLLGQDKKRLAARALVKAGVVSEVLLDTTGSQYADTRQVLSDGKLVRVEADTNRDHRPDVVQTYDGDALRYQDEDTDGDGVVDQRFEGEKAVPVPPGTKISREAFTRLDCGSFDAFWRKH